MYARHSLKRGVSKFLSTTDTTAGTSDVGFKRVREHVNVNVNATADSNAGSTCRMANICSHATNTSFGSSFRSGFVSGKTFKAYVKVEKAKT
jgi:hypothetical protein